MHNIRSFFSFLNNKPFTFFEGWVVNVFSKFPHLPKEIQNLIVSFGPYLVLIGGVVGILSILTLFSIGSAAFYSVYTNSLSNVPFYYLLVISSVVTGIMMVISFKDLKDKTLFGWRLVFWSFTISVITMIITLNIISAIVSAIISWYILVAVKDSYI